MICKIIKCSVYVIYPDLERREENLYVLYSAAVLAPFALASGYLNSMYFGESLDVRHWVVLI